MSQYNKNSQDQRLFQKDKIIGRESHQLSQNLRAIGKQRLRMSNEQILQERNKERKQSQFSLFIQSNQTYLREKFNQIFDCENGKETNKIKLNLIPIEKLVAYIYGIFSLQKYQSNPKIHDAIKTSVQENLKSYLKQLDPNKLSKSNQLTFQNLKQILLFIVQNNSIFSIQYENKSLDQDSALTKNQTGNYPFQVDILIDDDEKHDIINDNFGSQIIHGLNNKTNSFLVQNEFDIPNNFDKPTNQGNLQKLIKKNAKVLFDFYCRQQMELGGVITFDRLNQQTSSMSLGKCLTFAKATNLYNALIKRQDLVAKFKKVSEGKKYINFQKFEAMMGEFQVMDPNFNQRVGLLADDIRKMLKYVKLPFNTKDIQPRQKIAVRNFDSRLTEHSGQSSQELKINLEQKKHEIMHLRKIKQMKEYLLWKESRPQIVKQNDLKSSRMPKKKDLAVDLSFIGSIIHPEQEDQTYLKEHLIPNLEKQIQKPHKLTKIFHTQRYQSMDKLTLRKQSLLLGIKKRIKQIQDTENTSLLQQLKRSQMLSPKSKYIAN